MERRYHVNITVLSSIELVAFFLDLTYRETNGRTDRHDETTGFVYAPFRCERAKEYTIWGCFVSILRNLEYVTLTIFGIRKHFYKLAESSEALDVIMFTGNKPLRFYVLLIKEISINIPKQGF